MNAKEEQASLSTGDRVMSVTGRKGWIVARERGWLTVRWDEEKEDSTYHQIDGYVVPVKP